MVGVDGIPPWLKRINRWICWRSEDEKKPPISSRTGRKISPTDTDAATDFETALSALESDTIAADGLGFILTEDDRLTVFDLDNCVSDDRTINHFERRLIHRLNSYSEYSPSDSGAHVLVFGEKPGTRSRGGGIEMYDSNRYVTVTGKHIEGTPKEIKERSAAVHQIYERHLKQDSDESVDTSNVETERTSPILEDEVLIEKAKNSKNGDEFDRLWHGDSSGYDSPSDADLAFCNRLAFWTAKNPTQMDRLFRRSNRMREKWDEVHYRDGSTYGEKAIEEAIEGTDDDDKYDPNYEG